MYDQERRRATHLMILLCYTLMSTALIAESILLGWETGAIVLLVLGMLLSWGAHLTSAVSENIRLWLYVVLSMLSCFFYGIHETSMYDLAPLMIMIIIMFSAAESYRVILFCQVVYIGTMLYDFLFVVDRSEPIDPLLVTRIMLHFLLVCLSGYLLKVVIQRRGKEREQMEAKIRELEEVNLRTEDFLTNVSHELRTPINAVTGITTVILKNEQNEETRKNVLSIQKAGQRLFDQIEDILDFTEIDTGRILVSEDNYMITSIVNDIISGTRISEAEHNPELIFDVDARIPAVLSGDGRKIRKILKHLIGNAVKFTHKGGIYVRIYALPREYGINLCMRISDTGVGIAQEKLAMLTERFYQSDGGRSRSAGGLGLGLSIVQGMVSAMEGFMRIESNEGHGTTVSVSIPQKIVDEAPAMAVNDRERLCMACFLRTEKYEVAEVRSYYDALISHMISGLDVALHRVSSIDELKKISSMYYLTHLVIGKEEYEENAAYFESMDLATRVIVVAEAGFALPKDSRALLLKKPFYCLPVINLLNMEGTGEADMLKNKQMVCQDVHVLVVDDEPMNLMVAEGIFKDYRMSVKTASSGMEAVEICEKEAFDLIFLDHMMPEMDGVETLRRIRKVQMETGMESTVIAFTANAVSGAREMFFREGFDEFISKPMETLELERVLRKVLPRARISYIDPVSMASNTSIKVQETQTAPESCEQEEKMASQVQEGNAAEADPISALEKIGINVNSGLQYSRYDKEFYQELLKRFCGDFSRNEANLRGFFEKEDLENYQICVHTLKSTSKMIGADAFSKMAKSAEDAAKTKDAAYIGAHQQELLDTYRRLTGDIDHILNGGADQQGGDILETGGADLQGKASRNTGTELSGDAFLQLLTKLKSSLDTFEADKAETMLAESGDAWYQGISVSELLADVRHDIDDFEMAAAADKVSVLISRMKGGEE